MADTIEIKITTQNSQAIAVLKKVADAANQSAAEAVEQPQADFKQIQKALSDVNTDMMRIQTNLLRDVETGDKTGPEAIQAFATVYQDQTKAIAARLKADLAEAESRGQTDTANNIRTELAKIPAGINSFVEKLINQTDQNIRAQIDFVNADPSKTRLMKSYETSELERAQHRASAAILLEQADVLRTAEGAAEWSAQNKNKDITAQIQFLQTQARLEQLKGQALSLMKEVENAGRQSLENGLVNFFEQGYKSCHKLTDAVRELAISILTEMNKVFAQNLTRQIMFSLWPSSSTTSPWLLSDGTVLDPSFGLGEKTQSSSFTGTPVSNMGNVAVQGLGSGANDSFFTGLSNYKKFMTDSNGEYVIKADSVQKFGTGFFNKLDNGLIPDAFGQIRAQFADTGAVSGAKISGAQDLATSLSSSSVTNIPLKIINLNDPNEVGRYLSGKQGEKIMVNWMKNNAEAVRQVLKIRG
ncbi:MAG TPA: hypothetical protein PKA10_18355 [Selenomonadales bacterium]|nr:hypothetical protein [Selenomonadales bacterium]